VANFIKNHTKLNFHSNFMKLLHFLNLSLCHHFNHFQKDLLIFNFLGFLSAVDNIHILALSFLEITNNWFFFFLISWNMKQFVTILKATTYQVSEKFYKFQFLRILKKLDSCSILSPLYQKISKNWFFIQTLWN